MAQREATKVVYIKKKSRGHGHHGGAWKVAYADFVTSMMAFFMVLWLISQTDEVTRDRLSHYFRTGVFDGTPAVLEGGAGIQDGGPTDPSMAAPIPQQQLVDEAEQVRSALVDASVQDEAIRDALENVDVRVVDEGLLIEITDRGDDLIFDVSSSALTPALVSLLEGLAPALASLDAPLEIHGHTDARPFPAGSSRTNWDLSFERADSARRLLEASGVSADRVVAVMAHGSAQLALPEDPMSGANRRLSVLARRYRVPPPAPATETAEPALPEGVEEPATEAAAEIPAHPAHG